MQEYIAMWKNFANFKDRTSVRGYWMATLINIVVTLVLSILAGFISVVTYLAGLYSLALIIPGLAITVRRLRDAGKAWGWIFISLVPIAGPIILLVFLCQGTKNMQGAQV